MTNKELAEKALELAKEESLFQEAEETAVLDYVSTGWDAPKTLKLCSFDVVSHTAYGGSEGIYTDIVMEGYITPGRQKETLRILTLKTLETSKRAYLAMHTLGAYLAYYANEYVADNLDQFEG